MRRRIGLLLVGLGVTLALLFDGVGAAEPNVTAPSTAKVGVAFTITITNCADGEDPSDGAYDAFIDEIGKKPDGSTFSNEITPDDDGTTDKQETLSQVGTHSITFQCQHDSLSGAGTETFWEEPITIVAEAATVVSASLTAAERKLCKKKKTAKKRRACMKREALD